MVVRAVCLCGKHAIERSEHGDSIVRDWWGGGGCSEHSKSGESRERSEHDESAASIVMRLQLA